MRLLATLGGDPRLPNKDNSIPLIVAAGLGTYARERIRARNRKCWKPSRSPSNGNDINAVDNHGETAMHGRPTNTCR